MKFSKVADVSYQAALKRGKKKKIIPHFRVVRFVSQIDLLFLCGSVDICMATFRVQRGFKLTLK